MSFKDKPLKKCHTDKRKMIDDIHSTIIQELEGEDLLDYYQDNGLILNKYYSNPTKTSEKMENNTGILSYFSNSSNVSNASNASNSGRESSKEIKTNIINEYMSNIDDEVQDHRFQDYNYNKCTTCDINMCLDDIAGKIICHQCGLTKDIIIMTEKNSYNDFICSSGN